MQKIIVALDGSYYSESVLQHAIDFTKKLDGMLVGLFIEDLTTYYDQSVYGELYQTSLLGKEIIEEETQEVKKNVETMVESFNKTCEEAGIRYNVHKEQGASVDVLLEESLYADILLIGGETYFSYTSHWSDEKILHDVLKYAHCPVTIIPAEYRSIKQNIIAFDNSENAMHAIKQFCYIFGNVLDKEETTLLSILKEEGQQFDNTKRVYEYLGLHFKNLKVDQLVGDDPAEEILHSAALADDALLVLGGFGRNLFSRMLRKSVSKEIVKKATVPTFITHK